MKVVNKVFERQIIQGQRLLNSSLANVYSFLGGLLLMVMPCLLSAQGALKSGILSNFKTGIDLSNDWKLNSKIEARQIFWKNDLERELYRDYDYERTDIALMITKQFTNHIWGAGFMLRFKESAIIKRFSQMYAFKHGKEFLKIKHRFLMDQTLLPKENTIYRFRYQLELKYPLFYKKADKTSPYYLKSQQEFLLLAEKNYPIDYELRWVPSLGLALNKKSKIELGLDMRINGFRRAFKQKQFWFYLGWIQSI